MSRKSFASRHHKKLLPRSFETREASRPRKRRNIITVRTDNEDTILGSSTQEADREYDEGTRDAEYEEYENKLNNPDLNDEPGATASNTGRYA